jgi:quercetin dioxygenase-like cupin family protein
MKHSRWLRASAFFAVVALASAPKAALGQDPVKVAPQVYKVLLDNDQVRVLDIRLEPGGKSPMHSHPAYVVYAFSDGTVKFTSQDGKTGEAQLKAGQAAWREAETHAAENVGAAELHVLNIELKLPKGR